MPYTPRYTEDEDPDEVRKRMYLSGNDSPMDAPPFSPPDVQQAQQSAAILPVPAPKPTPMPPPPTDNTGPAAQLQQAPPQPVPTGKEDPGAAQSMKQPPPPPPAAMGAPAAPRAIDQLASLKAPEPTKPKWYQRLAAAGVGGAAGWVNAAGRTKVDPSAAIGEIMQPGYAAKTAAYQRKKADLGERAGYEQDQQKLDDAKEAKANKIKQDAAKLAEKAETDATAATAKTEAEKRKRFEDATGFVAKGGKILKIGEPVPNGYTPLPVNPSDPDSVYALPETKTHFQVGAKFRKSAEDAGVVLDDSTQLLSSDDFGKISGLIAKHIENEGKPAPNVTEAQMAMDSANPDPAISGPAKAALKNLADTKRSSVNVHVAAPGAALEDMSPEAIDQAASAYLKTGVMPNIVGRGASGEAARRRIVNRAAQMDPKADIAENKAGFGAEKTSLTDLTKKRDSILSFERTASANLDMAVKASKAVSRTGSPLINHYLLYLKGNVMGDKDTQLLQNVVSTAANEYAKVISNGNSVTNAARKEIETMLNARLADGTFEATVNQMKQEMGNRRAGYDKQLEEMKGRRSGGGGKKAGPPVGTVIDGHKFNGGDPNDERNWSTVK